MNVASLELCKELYELSGWDNKASTASQDRLRVWMQDYSLSEMGPAHDDYESTPPIERNKVNIYGWKVADDPRHRFTTGQEVFEWWYSEVKTIENNVIPAYSLGYLLRKLPKYLTVSKVEYLLVLIPYPDGWIADYYRRYRPLDEFDSSDRMHWLHNAGDAQLCEADTPEDAAAKLAIELFKQGILTK